MKKREHGGGNFLKKKADFRVFIPIMQRTPQKLVVVNINADIRVAQPKKRHAHAAGNHEQERRESPLHNEK